MGVYPVGIQLLSGGGEGALGRRDGTCMVDAGMLRAPVTRHSVSSKDTHLSCMNVIFMFYPSLYCPTENLKRPTMELYTISGQLRIRYHTSSVHIILKGFYLDQPAEGNGQAGAQHDYSFMYGIRVIAAGKPVSLVQLSTPP
eukprot:5045258-Pleurochrysis_carterae.AAC.1